MSKMTTTLKETGAYSFQIINESGAIIGAQANENMSGSHDKFRPMEMLLGAISACSAIDLRLILEKQRQVVDGIDIQVSGERDESEVPSCFKSITLHYTLKGDIDRNKADKAITLALYKYCSVQKHLSGLAQINYSLELLLPDQ